MFCIAYLDFNVNLDVCGYVHCAFNIILTVTDVTWILRDIFAAEK